MANQQGTPVKIHNYGYNRALSPELQTPTPSLSFTTARPRIHSPSRVFSSGSLSGSISTASRSCYVHAKPMAQEPLVAHQVSPESHSGNSNTTASVTHTQAPSYTGNDLGASLRAPSVPKFPYNGTAPSGSSTAGSSMKVPASLSNRHASHEDVGGNASTTASSVCDSQQQDTPDSSTKVIFAKASELIRIEIAAVEKRMIARLEAERVDRKKACDKMSNDLEAMVTIVERLSAQAEGNCVDVLLEEERQLRDMACASMHGKIEALSSQMRNLQRDSCLKEESVDALLDQEREARLALETSLREDTEDSNDPKLRMGLDEQYLNALLQKESKTRDVALATLRKELRLELEAMAMDVRSMAVRVPLFDLLEKQQNELASMFAQLHGDVQAVSSKMGKLLTSTNVSEVQYHPFTDNVPIYSESNENRDEEHSAMPSIQCQASVVRDGQLHFED